MKVKRYGDTLIGIKEMDDGKWVSHEDYSSLLKERDALAVENAGLKAAISCHAVGFTVCEACGEENISGNDDVCRALSETPATETAVANIKVQARIEGAHFVANRMLAAWEAGFIEDTAKNAADIARMILTSTEFMPTAPEGDFDRSFADGVLEDIAAQLRKEYTHD